MAYNLRLTVSCPDRKGLISALSSFISMHDLARAVRLHLEDRILVDGGRTVVFE